MQRISLLSFAASAALFAFLAAASPAAVADDLAGPGVARLSLLHGDVSVARGDSGDTVAAAINAPVLAADYVSTGADGRAEIQLDAAGAIRLGPGVQLRFASLESGKREAQLAAGTIELRTMRGDDGRPQIDTPSIVVRPLEAGSYRISVGDDGRTFVTARSGRAEVATAQGTQIVVPGNTLLAYGPAAGPTLQTVPALALDDFDRFNQERDRDVQAAAANSYVSADLAFDDYSRYGRWVAVPAYGRVWSPYVVADWAPYRYGRWVWEDSYGWTWVASEPWGWAPYHYGRWFHSAAYGWCWYPPAVAVVPVWSPALVGFFTIGGGGFSAGFGNIGWVPLAPYEPYRPWYGWNGGRYGPTVVNNITNITNVNITKIYVNSTNPNAVTVVPTQRFLLGKFDQRNVVAAADLRAAQPVSGAIPLAPSRSNLRFVDRPATAVAVQRRTLDMRAFAGSAPHVERIPFEQQRASLATAAHARVPEVIDGSRPADPWQRYGQSRGSATEHRSPPAASTQSHTVTPSRSVSIPTQSDAWSRYERSSGIRDTAVQHGTAPGTAPDVRRVPAVRGAPSATSHATSADKHSRIPSEQGAKAKAAAHRADPAAPKQPN